MRSVLHGTVVEVRKSAGGTVPPYVTVVEDAGGMPYTLPCPDHEHVSLGERVRVTIETEGTTWR